MTVVNRIILYAAAIGVLSISSFGQDVGQMMLRCSDLYAKAKYADAVDACTKVIVARPGSVEALQIRAAANEKRSYYAAALPDYSELIRLTNGSILFTFNRAEVHRRKANMREALADYTTIISKEPTGRFTAKAYFGRGLVYEQIGSNERAQDSFRKAVELDPGFAEAKAKVKTEYPFGDMTITQAADNIIPGIQPPAKNAKVPTPSATSAPQYRPSTPAPPLSMRTAPQRLLPERQGTAAEDVRFESIVTSRERRVRPTAADIVWASAYIYEQINYLKNRDSGGKTAAAKISDLYFRHSILRNILNDSKGEIADLTNCLVYSPTDTICKVARVYAHLAAGDFTAALTDVNSLLHANPNWTVGLAARAQVHCSMGNRQLAAADEKKAIHLGGRVVKPCP